MHQLGSLTILCSVLLLLSCSNNEETQVCEIGSEILTSFRSIEGIEVQIYDSGNLYITNNNCEFFEQLFEPDFFSDNYVESNGKAFIKVSDNELFEVFQSHVDDYESYNELTDLMLTDINSRENIYTNFTLQSPATPTSAEYVAHQSCILEATCNFIDNKLYLKSDPTDANNNVLAFHAVAPTPDMVVSKSSISSSALLSKNGEDFWFEISIYIEDGMPQTIADFESTFFNGQLGPRLSITNRELEVENKFGAKLKFKQDKNLSIKLPTQQWVKVKVHLQFGTESGVIQVWQDDQLIIDAIGKNIPVEPWVFNKLEIGISATQEETTMLIDDLKFSHIAF